MTARARHPPAQPSPSASKARHAVVAVEAANELKKAPSSSSKHHEDPHAWGANAAHKRAALPKYIAVHAKPAAPADKADAAAANNAQEALKWSPVRPARSARRYAVLAARAPHRARRAQA